MNRNRKSSTKKNKKLMKVRMKEKTKNLKIKRMLNKNKIMKKRSKRSL